MTITVSMPQFTMGVDAYDKVNAICQSYGRRVALLVGAHGYPACEAKLRAAIDPGALELSEPIEASGACTLTQIDRLSRLRSTQTADMLFAVGGGKVLDTAKAVGERLGKPVFTFPTIASNCAATTSVSIVYREDGRFDHPCFLAQGPAHCFIDTEVLAQAPASYLWAGMGDTYAKYYEAEVASRGEALMDALSLGVHVSQASAREVLAHGEAAYRANLEGRVTEALETVAMTVIVTTGLASLLLTLDHTPDYNSDLAHAIYYTMTGIPDYDPALLHGAVVSYGVLILLIIDLAHQPDRRRDLEQVRRFHETVGLPTSLGDLGLSLELIEPYLPQILTMPDVAHRAYRITSEELYAAILAQERWRPTPDVTADPSMNS